MGEILNATITISYIFCALFSWLRVRKTDLMKAISTDPLIQLKQEFNEKMS